jgi:RHS repeat-associated protein
LLDAPKLQDSLHAQSVEAENFIQKLASRCHPIECKILGIGIRGDIGAAIALEIGGAVYAPLHDFNGNIVAIISPDGGIAEKYEIDAFGKEQAFTPINPWRFSSKRSEEGLFFFGLRFYDPTLGRWLTPDPAGFADGANLYVYAQNNPLNRLDLFGLFSEEPFGHPQVYVPIPSIPRLPGFKTLFATGSIYGVRVDFVLCCGYWHQLQFTPEEIKRDQCDIMGHFRELIPSEGAYIGLVNFGNGINTTLEECFEITEAVGRKVGNTLVMALHNPTQGLGNDIVRTNNERIGVETRTVCLQRQFMAFVGEKMYNINPLVAWVSMPYSEGGVIAKRAIEGMSDAQKQNLRENLHIFAVGPAEPLSRDQGASVKNVYSHKDYVTGFGPFGQAKQFMGNPNYDIQVLPCISSWSDKKFGIADHGFLQPTYRKAWERHIDNLKDKCKFYQGSENGQTR